MDNGVYFEGAKLVKSFRAICFDNKKAKFIHYFNERSPLIIEFIFEDQNNIEKGKMNVQSIENGYFQILLPQQFNSLGTCNTETLEIGKFFDKKIFINFAIFCVTQKNPILDLSIYIEDNSYGKQ